MANTKGIGIIAGISTAVVIGIILVLNVENPSITQDQMVIEEEVVVDIILPQDSIAINESVVISKGEVEFFINENGTRTYIISAEDTPKIGG